MRNWCIPIGGSKMGAGRANFHMGKWGDRYFAFGGCFFEKGVKSSLLYKFARFEELKLEFQYGLIRTISSFAH